MSTSKSKLDTDKVAGAIARTLQSDFDGVEIVDVHVAEHVDQYGDDMLRIEVVFDGNLNGDDMARAHDRLFHVLKQVGSDLFPLPYFVSKSDYNRGRKRSARH
jgi:hypothetical protein